MEQSDKDMQFDLLIVGAGIYGATLAYEASQRGLSVLVLEKADIGAATSANSLKVIHGGLRYLQSFDIVRTRYSADERKRLMAYAPHLVKPLHCLVPLSRSVVKNELSVGLVAGFYNWLTRTRNEGMPEYSHVPNAGLASLARYQANAAQPLRDAGSFALDWHDAQASDTERLLTLFLKDAARAGAVIRNYHTVVSMAQTGLGWRVECLSENGDRVAFGARAVVDCSGAWSVAERLLKPEGSRQPMAYVKAVNLITRRKLGKTAFGFNSRQGNRGRLLFAAPCGNHTLIGTWYFDENSPDAPTVSREVAERCIQEINEAFEQPVLTLADITHVHVGYLPSDERKTGDDDPEAWLMRHNKTLSWAKHPGLWVVKGTKYTTARYEAEQFLDAHEDYWASGSPSKAIGSAGLKPLADHEAEARVAEIEKLLTSEVATGLKARYGRCYSDLIEFVGHTHVGTDVLDGTNDHLCAEVLYAVQHEWAVHLDDILVRRLGLGSLERPSKATINQTLELLQSYSGWSTEHCQDELHRLNEIYPNWSSG